MTNYVESGTLEFKVKVPEDLGFRVGIFDKSSSESWIEFPANTSKYGLTRNGEWSSISIPISDFSNDLDFTNIHYLFTLSSLDSDLPTSSFTLGIDEILWRQEPRKRSYATWIGDHPLLTNTAVTDDEDHDGIPNILEYALGCSPHESNSPKDYEPTFDKASRSLTFSRSIEAITDTTQSVEYSTDLQNWSTIDLKDSSTYTQVSTTDTMETLSVSLPETLTNETSAFWRISASLTE